jgi:hypothetical protein
MRRISDTGLVFDHLAEMFGRIARGLTQGPFGFGSGIMGKLAFPFLDLAGGFLHPAVALHLGRFVASLSGLIGIVGHRERGKEIHTLLGHYL